MNKHSVAVAEATTPVVDQAASAYKAAEALYDERVDYESVARFDDTRAVYDPRKIQPLMPEKDVQIRLAVLAAFQCYTQKLVSLTGGTSSPALDASAKSLGSTLTSFGNTLAPSIESTLGVVTATAASTTSTASTTAAPLLTPDEQNGIATAAEALGMFLNSRKIKRDLPPAIEDMDKKLQALCTALEGDIDTLRAEEQMDFNIIRTEQTVFLRTTNGLDPERRREQIMKLPQIVRQQRLADAKLVALHDAIVKLAITHHALATAVQGNNPESLKEKLSDLSGAGSDLGKFYGTLSSK